MYTVMTVRKAVCGLLLFYSPVVNMYLLLSRKNSEALQYAHMIY